MSAGRKRHLWSLPRADRSARSASTDTSADTLGESSAAAVDPSPDATRAARFSQLHEASYAGLLRFVQRRVPGQEAEDVVASVFETAWVRLDDVPEDARPWLFGVARNAMANHSRAAVRRTGLAVRLVSTTTAGAGVDPGEHDGVGARIDLVRAWRTLTKGDQEVLSLVAFDGLRGEQAAEVLGISRSAFAMRLQRARQRLASALHADATQSRQGANSDPPSAARPAPTPHHSPAPITAAST